MAKTHTRSAFEKLSPTAQGEHIRAGGIVVDAPGFEDHTPKFFINGLDRMRAGNHAEKEWAARVAARYEDNGFPQLRQTEKQEAVKPVVAASPEADGSTLTRKEVFAHLQAGGLRDGLPAEFVADYDRSARAWGR